MPSKPIYVSSSDSNININQAYKNYSADEFSDWANKLESVRSDVKGRTYYELPQCYIYLYHTDEFFILPQYPSSVSDTLESNFSSQNALARTAPVFSYNNSGPRSVDCTLQLHRDMMNDANIGKAQVSFNDGTGGKNTLIENDYVDILIKKLQAIALPRYSSSEKLVDPPIIAIRFGDDIFIKGVVASGGISVNYELPLLANNKYAQVKISFRVSETQPYDADSAGLLGSFRGLSSSLKDKIASMNA